MSDYYGNKHRGKGLLSGKGHLRLAACGAGRNPLRFLHKGKADPHRILLGLQQLRKEMEGLSRKDRLWIASMEKCRKYCGCHQMPERSFFIGDYQFPLCARCTGIMIGHVLGVITAFFCRVPIKVVFGILPLAVDGSVQKYTDYESNNRRRLMTGILYGFSFMSACIYGARRIYKKVVS